MVTSRQTVVIAVSSVTRRVRQMLGVADDVVAGVADRSAAETGQLRMRSGSIAGDQRFELLERIGDLPMSDTFWLVVFATFGQRDFLAERFQSQEWRSGTRTLSGCPRPAR